MIASPRADTRPLRHRLDPLTSHEAAARMVATGTAQTHREIVMDAVREYPGSTAGEIGAVTALGRFEAARRLSDLHRLQEVVQGPPRRCLEQGTRQVTWWARPEQGRLL